MTAFTSCHDKMFPRAMNLAAKELSRFVESHRNISNRTGDRIAVPANYREATFDWNGSELTRDAAYQNLQESLVECPGLHVKHREFWDFTLAMLRGEKSIAGYNSQKRILLCPRSTA